MAGATDSITAHGETLDSNKAQREPRRRTSGIRRAEQQSIDIIQRQDRLSTVQIGMRMAGGAAEH